MLRMHDTLNGIGNQITRRQAVPHPLRPHGDSIAHPNRVKPEPHHARVPHSLVHHLGQTEQVHVAGIPLVPNGGDAHLGLGHVVVGEANAIEDGLGAALGLGLGNAGAVLIELQVGGGGSVGSGADGEAAEGAAAG